MKRLILILALLFPSGAWANALVHATDCTDPGMGACDAGRYGTFCYEQDARTLYICDANTATWELMASAVPVVDTGPIPDCLGTELQDAAGTCITDLTELNASLGTGLVTGAHFSPTAGVSTDHGAAAVGDTDIADGAVDGGLGGEIADASITADDLAANSITAADAAADMATQVEIDAKVNDTGDTMGGSLIFPDSITALFGTDSDASISWDGAFLQVNPQLVSSSATDFTGSILVARDEDEYSHFGPTAITTVNDSIDKLVAVKNRSDTTNARRAVFASLEIVDNVALATSGANYGINGFVFTDDGVTVTSSRTSNAGGATGGRYAFRHRAAGTFAMGGGVSSRTEIQGSTESGVITDGYAFLAEDGDGGAGSGGITNYHDLWIKNSTGNVTTKNAIYIEDQTNASTDIGIRIDGADTNAVWLGAGSAVTTAADGITFGSGKDVTLYRSAADTLKTDDALLAYKPVATSTGGALAINTVTIATAAADYDLPDECDSATGAWVTLQVRDGSETASLTVTDATDTINYKGLTMNADDELDSSGSAFDSITVVCMETNQWYTTADSGGWTDGGVAD